MKPEFKVDTREFERSLVQYRVESGKSWREVIREQARLLLVRLLKLTPPRKQTEGRKAVAGDIRRVMTDFGRFRFDNPKIQKEWEDRNWNAMEVIFGRSDKLSRFDLSDDVHPAEHRRARNTRGRVPKGNSPKVLVKKPAKLKRYITGVQKRVGITKAGWAAGMRSLGAKLPAWVARHGTSFGSVQDATNRSRDPSMRISNHARGIGPIDRDERILAVALRGRARDMKTSLKKKLQHGARRAKFK